MSEDSQFTKDHPFAKSMQQLERRLEKLEGLVAQLRAETTAPTFFAKACRRSSNMEAGEVARTTANPSSRQSPPST